MFTLYLLVISALVGLVWSVNYQEFFVDDICATYRGMVGDMAAAAVYLEDRPAIIR